MHVILAIILFCIYAMGGGVAAVGLSIHGPSHVYAGDTVTLECIVPGDILSQATFVEWRYRADDTPAEAPTLIYQLRFYPTKQRYFPPATVAYLNQSTQPETAISMPMVSVERNGEYYCSVEGDEGDTLETTHKLAVIRLPVVNISMSFEEDDQLSVGQEVSINCTVTDGHPPPSVYWVLGDSRLDIDNTNLHEGQAWKALQSRLKVSEEHLGKRLGCHAKVISNQDREYVAKSSTYFLNSAGRGVASGVLLSATALILTLLFSS